MALVYKSGQGYWVRVMTAVGAGILVLAAAAWGYDQAGTIDLPTRALTMEFTTATGAISPGDTLDVLAPDPDNPDTDVVVGSATVADYSVSQAGSGSIEIDSFSGPGVIEFGLDASVLRAGAAEAPSFSALVRPRSVQPIAAIQMNIVQTAVAGGIIVLGAVMVYWFVAVNRRSADFLIATDGEMKKVNWSTRKEILGSTQVVIVASFLIAGFLFLVDRVFAQLFMIIGVLEG